MIAFIDGIIDSYNADSIVLNHDGMGWQIFYPHIDQIHLNEDASRKMMVEMRDKARKAMDNFYDRIRAGIPLDEIDEAEFQNTKDAFRTAEHNLQQIEKKGKLPKGPPAKIKQYIPETFGELTSEDWENEKSTAKYRALLENLVDSIRVAPSTVTIRLKVRCSWCLRVESDSIAFILDFVLPRPKPYQRRRCA